MKRLLKVPILALAVLLFGAVQNKASAQVSVGVSFQTFYDDLSPYGQWIDYPQYGYVWMPDRRYSNFHPYQSEGHWAWSEDYGWLWVSDYEWGWAPFHYGRWVYDDWYGWLWIPDYEWGPAWVVWRGGGDYYGWAPLGPGINISINIGSRWNPPYNYWCFAPRRYINSPYISNYYIDRSRYTTIISNTTIINNYGGSGNYVMGPSRYDAERYTGSRIDPVRVRDMQRAGRTTVRRNEVSIYRPEISRRSERNAPRNFETYRQRGQSSNDRQSNGNARIERPYENRGNQRIDRQQYPGGNDQRVDRQQFPNRNDQRMERQQVPDQNNQRPDRSYQGRGRQIERPEYPGQNDQRIERQQVPNRNDQRMERQQYPGRNDPRVGRQQMPDQNNRPYQNRGNQRMERQQYPQNDQRIERQQYPSQNQRIERQQTPNQSPQQMERPYQNRGQQPQVQGPSRQEQRGNGNGNGNGRGRGRGN